MFKQIISKFDETTQASKKKNIITKVLRLPFEDSFNEGFDSFSEFVIELLIEKRHFNIIAKSPELMKSIYDMVRLKSSRDSDLKEIIKILININEQLIRELGGNVGSEISYYSNNFEEDQCYPSSAETLELKSKEMAFIFDYIYQASKTLLDDFTNPNTSSSLKPIPSSFGLDIVPIGLKKYENNKFRILILDFFYSLLALIIQFNENSPDSNNISNLQQLFTSSFLFKSIVVNYLLIKENYFKYEWNNMYQKTFEGIISLITKKFTSSFLVDSVVLFDKLVLQRDRLVK